MHQKPRNLHQSPRRLLHLYGGGVYQAAKGVHFPPHRHPHMELVYYRSGTVECVTDQRRPGHAGLIWLTPPGVTHAERAVTAYTNYYIALESKGNDWPAFLDDDADRSVGRVCQQIVIETNRPSPQRGRMLELLAAQLSCLLDRVSSETVLSGPALTVARAEHFIEEKCGRPLTLREVARAVHAAPSTLRGHFKALRGCSPREHLRQVRLNRAIGFLRTSTLKLEVVAEVCGFDSASHLSRRVKSSTGRTPGQLRRSGRLGRTKA